MQLFSVAQDVTLPGPGPCNASASSGSWTVPCGVTNVTIQVYGGGGGAGGGGGGSNGGLFDTRGGGGAGGGGYTTITIDVTPGSSFSYTVGAGGCGGGNGSDGDDGDDGSFGGTSTFNGTDGNGVLVNLAANGGSRGTGGDGTEGSPGSGGSGGGASGGSTNTPGSSGNSGSGGNGGNGGNGAGPSGGAGGASTGAAGNTYGGGGAGGGNSSGGRGAAGGILITFNATTTIAIPTISSTPPTCTLDGSSVITNYDAAMTYIFTPAGPSAGAGGIITGMVTGTSYTVIARDAGGCDSQPSASFSNAPAAPLPVPVISTTPPTCAADGSSTITNYNAALTYNFTPAGPAVGSGGVITGMTAGTSYTVESTDGICTSAVSAPFSNAAQLVSPAVPVISTTAPTCTADGSSTITNYDASFTYTFSPSGPSAGSGGAISGMAIGTSYTVEADNGSCASGQSAAFINNAQLTAPAVPVISTTSATCTAEGSSAISNYDGSLTYIFTPSGPSAGVSGAISGMTAGTSYTVEADNGSCLSGQSAAFVNDAQLPVPVAVINGSLSYCTGGNTTLTASGGTGFTWTDTGGNNIGSTASVTVTQGTYTVVVTNASSCSDTASATVTESTSLTVTITGASSICPGASATLTATGGTSYSWSTGSAADSIIVTQQGTYSVTASDNGCTGTASASVTEFTTTPVNLGSDVTACADSLVTLNAGSGYAGYAWSSGETTQTIAPQTSGSYSVTATDANSCTTSDAVVVVIDACIEYNAYFPSAFSPNGDGANDVFHELSKNAIAFNLKVFNRWGEQVFESDNIHLGWDGTYKGELAEMGVYGYCAEVTFDALNKKTFKGSVTLVR